MNAPAPAAKIGCNRPALIATADLARDFFELESKIAAALADAGKAVPVAEDDDDISALRALARPLVNLQKDAEAKRTDTKAPYLDAERVVDSYFNSLKKRLADAQKRLESVAKVYLDKKAAEERARREEEARQAVERARQEQERAREAAAASRPVEAAVATQASMQAAAQAATAQKAAEAKPAELARTRTADGGMATLKREYGFEIIDLAQIDLEALRPFIPQADIEKAIRRFVSTHQDTRQLAGVRIFETTSANFR